MWARGQRGQPTAGLGRGGGVPEVVALESQDTPPFPNGEREEHPGLLGAVSAPIPAWALSQFLSSATEQEVDSLTGERPRPDAWSLGTLPLPHPASHLELCIPEAVLGGGGVKPVSQWDGQRFWNHLRS